MVHWKKNLFAITAAQFFVRVGQTFINPYLVLFIRDDLHISNVKYAAFWAGLSTGAIFIGQFLMSPLWGVLADKYGPKLMVLRTTIAVSVFMFLTSMVNNVYELFSIRFIMGCFSGFNASAILLIAYETPDEKTGTSMGIFQVSQTTGLIIGPVLGGILAHFFGYRLCFVFASLMNLMVFFFVLFTVKETRKINSNIKNIKINKMQGGKKKISLRESFSIVFSNKLFLLMYIFIFITQISIREIEPQIALFVNKLYSGQHLVLIVALVFTATACADVVFAPIAGKISDKKGSFFVLYWSTIFAGFVIIAHIFAYNVIIFIILRFLYGVGVAGILPSVNALIARNAPKGRKGAVFGLTASITALGNFLGPFLGGVIVGLLGVDVGFIFIFIFTGLLFLMNNLFIKKVTKYNFS